MEVQNLILCLGDLHIPDRAIEIPQRFQKLITRGRITRIILLGTLTDLDTIKFLRSITTEIYSVQGGYDSDKLELVRFLTSDTGAPGPGLGSSPAGAGSSSGLTASIAGLAGSMSLPSLGAQISGRDTGPATSTGTATGPIYTNLSGIVEEGSFRIGLVNSSTIVPPAHQDALLMVARQMDVHALLWSGTHELEISTYCGRLFINPGSATGAFSTSARAMEKDPVPTFTLLEVQGEVLTTFIYTLTTDENGEESHLVAKHTFRKNPDEIL